MNWIFLHPKATLEMLGFIPTFLSDTNPVPAVKQLDQGYRHGGGWDDFKGFTYRNGRLEYPGDPPMRPLASVTLCATPQRNEERVVIFEYAWVAVFQPDESFRVARLD